MGMQLGLVFLGIVQRDRPGWHIQDGHGAVQDVLQDFVLVQRGDHDLGNIQYLPKPLDLLLQAVIEDSIYIRKTSPVTYLNTNLPRERFVIILAPENMHKLHETTTF